MSSPFVFSLPRVYFSPHFEVMQSSGTGVVWTDGCSVWSVSKAQFNNDHPFQLDRRPFHKQSPFIVARRTKEYKFETPRAAQEWRYQKLCRDVDACTAMRRAAGEATCLQNPSIKLRALINTVFGPTTSRG